MKERCYFNQIIAINDNQTLNLPNIYVKSGQWGIGQRGGRERQRERIRGERERSSFGVKK